MSPAVRIVFLLEEPSMARFVEALMPRAFPGAQFMCVVHEGKNDLSRRLRRRLEAWQVPNDVFVVVLDQDSSDCRKVKLGLARDCRDAGKPGAVVRIACRELEAWYLGDPDALAAEYGERGLSELRTKARFRDPDRVQTPSLELEKRLPEFGKIDAARRMGARISLRGNRSASFRMFLSGVQRVAKLAVAGEEE